MPYRTQYTPPSVQRRRAAKRRLWWIRLRLPGFLAWKFVKRFNVDPDNDGADLGALFIAFGLLSFYFTHFPYLFFAACACMILALFR